MPDRSRISKNAAKFTSYLQNLDKLQLSVDDVSFTPKWQLWLWTEDESEQITAFRQEAEETYKLYAEPSKVSTLIRTKMKLLIARVRSYDNDAASGHHLLDKIGSKGSLGDCITANVKWGTALAASTGRRHSKEVTKKPALNVRTVGFCYHQLSVTDSENVTKKGVPEGIRYAFVFRYVGISPPLSLSDYSSIGVAKYGSIISKFKSEDYDRNLKYRAWYYARYESSTGVMGSPGNIVEAPLWV